MSKTHLREDNKKRKLLRDKFTPKYFQGGKLSLQILLNNKSIYITETDSGNIVVVMNRIDFENEAVEHPNDQVKLLSKIII